MHDRQNAREPAGVAGCVEAMAAKRRPTDAEEPKRGRGRPAAIEPQAGTMLHLREEQVQALIDTAAAIRRKTLERGVNRSAIVRGILDAVLKAGPDLTACASESDIRMAVEKALRGR